MITAITVLDTNAQDTLVLDAHFQRADWRDFGYLLVEDLPEEHFEGIMLKDSLPFRPLRNTGLSFLPDTKMYWVKCNIRNNTTSSQQLILEVENPMINYIRLFVVGQDGTVRRSMLTGDAFPFLQREIRHRNFLFPLQVPAGEQLTCYLYADKKGESMALPATWWRQDAFIEAEQQNLPLLIGYFGFLFTFVFLSGIATVIVRTSLYGYFFLYTLSSALTMYSACGLGFQFLWSDFPTFASVSGYIFSSFAILSLLAFMRRFFQTKQHFPRLDRVIQLVFCLTLGYWPVFLFYKCIPPPFIAILIPMGHMVIFFYCMVVITTPIITYRRYHDMDAIWFLLAFSFTLVGILIHNLEIFDVLDCSLITQNAIRGGIAIDIFVISMVLGNKVRQTISENDRINRELDQLKFEAANALLEGQQSERMRLSRELHDGVSLLLATIRMRLSNLQYGLPEETDRDVLSSIIRDVGKVTNDVRRFTHALAPINLSEQSFSDAVEDMIIVVEQALPGLQIQCDLASFDTTELSNFTVQAVFQTIQELIANVLKHARATEVVVRVEIKVGMICLSVEDNGIGFSIKEGDGIGLKNIQARATLLNGSMVVKRRPGGGSFVGLYIPS